MTVGILVTVIAIFFVIGNIMGLKPKTSEVRVGQMRLLARKMDLHPKLVPTPSWLSPNEKMIGKNGMIAQYTVMDDLWQLPAKHLLWINESWRYEDGSTAYFSSLPNHLSLHIKGLTTKANSITIYWQDELYAKSFSIRDEQAITKIEQDLKALKVFLQDIGVQNSL